MYNNDDLRTLISDARNGGQAEYGRLQVAVYETLGKCINSDPALVYKATATHGSVLDSVAEVLTPVVDALINKYDESVNSLPLTYIVNGWKLKVRHKYQSESRKAESKHANTSRYVDHLERNCDPFATMANLEDREAVKNSVEEAIKTLPLKQQDVLEGYVRRESCEVTGELMGLTPQRIHQIRHEAIGVLQQILKD